MTELQLAWLRTYTTIMAALMASRSQNHTLEMLRDQAVIETNVAFRHARAVS